jgi:hypothetical protein
MKWSSKEIEIIKKYDNKEELLKLLPGRNWDSIRKFRYKIVPEQIKPCVKWSENELSIIKRNYESMGKEELIQLLPDRSWDSIKLKSNKINIIRSNDCYRKSNMDILMEDKVESFYWIGFILADGHISNNERISISLSIKDIEHLQKFVDYVSCSDIIIKDTMCSISLQNKEVGTQINNKFNIKSNKTYEPMNIKDYSFNKELLFSLIIGFIDGDGSIHKVYKRKDCNLRIHLHSSWLDNLIFIEKFIYDYFSIEKKKTYSHISNDGYSLLTISDNEIITKLKKECIRLKLPIMSRKWDRIDENRVSRNILFNNTKDDIIKLYKSGLSPLEIISKLNLKKGVVYKHIRNYNNNI